MDGFWASYWLSDLPLMTAVGKSRMSDLAIRQAWWWVCTLSPCNLSTFEKTVGPQQDLSVVYYHYQIQVLILIYQALNVNFS
jgi:hypothetical protein